MRPARPRRLLAYRLTCAVIAAALRSVLRLRVGPAVLPAGPLLVAPNHVSPLDPAILALALLRRGRVSRFVAMEEVFALRVVGPKLRYFDQLPFDREKVCDLGRLAPIEEALRRGECVVIYPEGRMSDRPDHRPVRGQPGVAYLASRTGAPIVPVAHWGTHDVSPRPRRRRPIVGVRFGEQLRVPAGASTSDCVRATHVLMSRIGSLVEALAELPIERERRNSVEYR